MPLGLVWLLVLLLDCACGETKLKAREERVADAEKKKTFSVHGVSPVLADAPSSLIHIWSSHRVDIYLDGDARIYTMDINATGRCDYERASVVPCISHCTIRWSPYKSWCLRVEGGQLRTTYRITRELGLDWYNVLAFICGIFAVLLAPKLVVNEHVCGFLAGGFSSKAVSLTLHAFFEHGNQYVDYCVVVSGLFTGFYVFFEGPGSLGPEGSLAMFLGMLYLLGFGLSWYSLQHMLIANTFAAVSLVGVLLGHVLFGTELYPSLNPFAPVGEVQVAKKSNGMTTDELRRLSEFMKQNPSKWLNK
eukprot:NODE_1369_length_989_cov_43.557447_g1054_i0.p1 GENE.NODE_1369_length_989_cov_43.557447_g1054_i0~~NODE_1369_length_989_cov_43.557447_g1054_i0.p1  ORF type:complete len:305 (+),score=43.12 NODE_1369_length_989_cov_43.557447_g1054_i0:57-971(+)